MSEVNSNSENWRACAPEYLASLSRQAHAAKHRRSVMRNVGGALVVLCVVGLGVWGLRPVAEDQGLAFGGITCDEAHLHLADYRAGKLPQELASRVEIHFRDCPGCQDFLRQMEADRTTAAIGQGYFTCRCARCQRHSSAAIAAARPDLGDQPPAISLAQLALLD